MKKTRLKTRQHGFTLIEIMIALVLGAFLIGGVLQIFLSSKQTYRMQDNLSRIQENGRFAMEFISRDVRGADYWGCLGGGSLSGNITNNLDPAGAGYDSVIDGFGQGIEGTNGAAGANLALDAPDSITLRGAYGGIAVMPPFGPQASANINVTAGNNLTQGEIVIVSDCSKGDIFQISNANPSTSGTVVHNTGNATSPGNKNANPATGCPSSGNKHCLSKIYRSDAQILKTQTVIYSIQNGASGQPALFKKVNGAPAVEMIEGIENMQILYGEDTDLPVDGTPNYYVPAGTVGLNMDQVISVRISLLAVSLEDNLTSQPVAYIYNDNGTPTTPTDRKLRRVFTSTIVLRNRLRGK